MRDDDDDAKGQNAKSLGDKRRGMTKTMPRGKMRTHWHTSELKNSVASELESNIRTYDVTSE